jgi:hypothetical protein
MKKDKRTNNDLQNINIKPLKNRGELRQSCVIRLGISSKTQERRHDLRDTVGIYSQNQERRHVLCEKDGNILYNS